MSQDPLLGATISLISKKDVRYEGTLAEVNSEESTISLENVKVFGTEDRRTGEGSMAPRDDIFAYVVFSGSDIKDLNVVGHQKDKKEKEAPKTPAKPPTQQREEAIKSHKPLKEKPKQETKPKKRTNSNNQKERAVPGMGKHLLNRKLRGVKADSQKNLDKEIENDFDFSAMNEKFNQLKLSLLGNENDKTQADSVEPKLPNLSDEEEEEDDFFDTMSSNLTDKQQGKKSRPTMKEERNLNTETFGAIALVEGRRFGRGRRYNGRGRGGRRKGRGNKVSAEGSGTDGTKGQRRRGGGRRRYHHNQQKKEAAEK
eukprot:maker-scaffold_9-snap-gene-6.48-mRNA-1 protein AED:0.15 eAED:0.15 QI:90/1/1/1/1/1/4/168/312